MSKRSDGGANYDFDKQVVPAKRMGQGSFANMPDKPIMANYSKKQEYRDGIINSFTCTLEETSGIAENKKSEY